MRPLAVMFLTAVGGVIGFVGFRELRRRRRRPHHSSAQDSADSVSLVGNHNEAESGSVSAQRTTHLVLRPRIPDDLSLVRVLFEFLILVISILLAWIVSPGDSQLLVMIHMVMVWMSLRSVGVSLPSVSELEDDKPHSTSAAIRTPLKLPSSSDKPDIDGDSTSRIPVLFLGRPPPLPSNTYHWIGPVSATFKVDICSAVHNYWTFFGSDYMPKLTAELIDNKVSLAADHLIQRAVRLQFNPPYFVRSALGGVSDVEISERSVWNPENLTFRVHSCNISSRNYVTVMDICEIQRDRSNPDWTCMTRKVCYQVSDSVGMLRSSLQALIKTMIHKKAQEFVVKFESHLQDSELSPDPNNVLALIGKPSSSI